MPDFDIAIVGAGCAGTVAAYEAAKAGKSVLLVERGNFAGSKNMTGGRLYTHSLEKVFPDFRESAPLERKVTHERISLMTEDANFTVDFSSDAMNVEGQESYTVLRAPFDQWLAEQAEEAGAEVLCGIPVDGLTKDESGAITGIVAGEDEITASVTILCDGVNSLLSQQAVGAQRPKPNGLAVGIKQTIELPTATITDRIMAAGDDEGMAWLLSGYPTMGTFGGGFIYTNKDSISIGIVAGIQDTMTRGKVPIYEMMENLKKHPAIAPLIRGGKVVEHSGHMVPEGGLSIMPKLIGDGVMLAGESAMMCVNLGYQVRGMDFAIAAGQIAGIEACKAIDAGDVTANGLAGYTKALEDSFVMKDLRRFSKAPAFMEGFHRMFDTYPEAARDMMNGMFIVDGSPAEGVKSTVMPVAKRIGLLNLLRDGRGAMKAL